MHRIAEAIVADIALRRAVPRVFLLDERGRTVAWPSSGDSALPPDLEPLLDMYFAQEPGRRERFSELVTIDGATMTIRIMPYDGLEVRLFALMLEPFALRSRSSGAGKLSSLP